MHEMISFTLWHILFICFYVPCICDAEANAQVDPAQSFISGGPGIDADSITLPVRYLYVQAVDRTGAHLNSPPAIPFQAAFSGLTASGSACRSIVEVLDLHDGRFLVRFRPLTSCFDAKLHVTYDGRHVAGSPIKFKTAVQPEHCSCPSSTLGTWIDSSKCPHYSDIAQKLDVYSNMDFTDILNRTLKEFNSPHAQSYCNYIVQNNRIYRRCYGKYQGFNMFVDAILLSLSRKAVLPDVEFLFNLGDWPLIGGKHRLNLPMFSWCGSEDSDDLVWPTYDLTGSTLDAMHRVALDMMTALSRGWLPWAERNSTAFWRGRDSRRERLDLVAMSRARPDLIDAAITHFFFFKDEQRVYGPTQSRVSFFDFFKYKYQISVDGTVAAYRLPYLLAGGSLLFKQKSKYYEHFYHGLVPGEHFIEVEHDLSDLYDKIEWAKKNDHLARAIAEKGRRFAEENLMPLAVICYHAEFLQQWSRRQHHKISVRDGMEEVSSSGQTEYWSGECACHNSPDRDEL